MSHVSQWNLWARCTIWTTAGRLQVQISFPSASLLIKLLNGLQKVVLGVKTLKQEQRRHARTPAKLQRQMEFHSFGPTDI